MFKFDPFLAAAAACIACVACGASFTSSDGAAGSGGEGKAGDATGGSATSAGSSNGGEAGEAELGGSSSAGQGSVAGSVGSGGSSVAGSVGSGGSAVAGSVGNGGSSVGGSVGSGGNATGGECAKLRQEYQAAVEKARVCDKGSTEQCTPSSVMQPISCGCPVLVNAKSEATTAAKKAYQAVKDAKCDFGGIICDIACAPVMSASCAQQNMTSGNTFVCTAGIAIQN